MENNQPLFKISAWKITVYILIIIAGIFVFFQFAEIKTLAKLFKQGGMFWIILAVAVQLSTYAAVGLCYRSLLVIFGGKGVLSIKDSFKSSVIMTSLARLIPAYNVGDNGFFLYFIKKRGFPIQKGIQAVFLEILLYYLALFLFFILGMLYLIFHPQIDKLYLRASFIFSLIVLLFGVFVFWFLAKKKGLKEILSKAGKIMNKVFPSLRLSNLGEEIDLSSGQEDAVFVIKNKRRLLFWPFVWRFMTFLIDALVIYFLFLAFDTHVYFGIIVVVLALSQAIGIFSIGPGGLGFFEGAMIFLYQNLFIPIEISVAVTLLFRGLSFWLPMPFGIWLYSKIVKNNGKSGPTPKI